ncbi:MULTISPECIES: MBL fold metallo-hydrolase [unclassified Salipiger]|uniref:MBL fold metallo-hydrolase n=1 Tax=unclassified Salipiger TaxID=2640570 RepID=UPI0013BAE718|nr:MULTISPECIES: MBL fold metallo-hydrolase [unclassified Salipiger]NDV48242.1 MBL fold metallo-hydrolase [Salipiger sp. PrR003]NDW35470.1 MBL fold metallo-hydrolase [Salipiger sp. PrR007]
MPRPVLASAAALIPLLTAPLPAEAQERRASHCIAIADAAPGIQYLHQAAWTDPVPEYSVRIQYLSHASFLIQTRGGLNVVTDFTGYIGNVPMIPDVVTMNHAHTSHWTPYPDPAIPHILEGWGPFGEGIEHHLDLSEMLVRNVSTDIRSAYGGTEENGNSIFVFEVEGLCIGHLGHLHHEPSDAQYAALGRIDVLMVPVDGGMTMPLEDMERVVERLRSSLILPMHWFSGASLERFIADVSDTFVVERRDSSELVIGLNTLPPQPTVMVLPPEWLGE